MVQRSLRCGGMSLALCRKVCHKKQKMVNKKTVFIAFAIEDERKRDFLKGQTALSHCPFEYVDISVKEPYAKEWKDRVRTRIRRSDGVIVLISKNSPQSTGQKWEIECAKEEKKPILGIWAYGSDKTMIPGVTANAWDWATINNFINKI